MSLRFPILMGAFVVSSLTFACDDGGSDDGAGGQGGSGGKASSSGSSASDGGSTSSGGSSDGGAATGGNGSVDVPDEWLGDTPHAALVGKIGGKDVSVAPSDEDAAKLGVLYCERNYVVPDAEDESTYGDGIFEKVELKYNFFFEEVQAEFQLELANDDLLGVVGETLEIGEATGVAAKISLSDADETEYEDEAVSGTVKLELLSGTPGEDGLVIADQTGEYGAYVDVEFASGGFLRGTFTARCGDNDIETAE